jgi:sulfonate transport system substrate-binding protein
MAVVLGTLFGVGDAPAEAASRVASVPSGTTLRVADQEQELQLPLKLSGEAAKIPYSVQYSNFLGAPAVFQAFQAGAVDLSFVGDAGIIPPEEAGDPFEVVAVFQNTGGGWGILVGPGQRISSVKELRGKDIGYEAGTADQSYILQLLKNNGLTPADVHLTNLPYNAITPALRSGDIVATPTEALLSAQYLQENPGSKVIQTPGVYSGLDFVVAAKSALADPAKRAAINDYLQRLVWADNWVNNHEKAYVSAFYQGVLDEPASLDRSVLATIAPTHFLPVGPAVITRQQETTNLFTAAGALPGHLDAGKDFITSFNKTVAEAQSGQ